MLKKCLRHERRNAFPSLQVGYFSWSSVVGPSVCQNLLKGQEVIRSHASVGEFVPSSYRF